MRKRIFMVVALLLVLVSSGVYAKDFVYYWDFISSTEQNYAQNEGLIEYSVYLDNYNDGLQQYLRLDYGLTDKLEFRGNVTLTEGVTDFGGIVKSNVYSSAASSNSLQLYLNYSTSANLSVFELTPSLLNQLEIARNFKLHSNLYFKYTSARFTFMDGSVTGYRWYLDNGFTFQPAPDHTIKAALSSYLYKLEFDTFTTELFAAYLWNINNRITYNFYLNREILDLSQEEEPININLTNGLTFALTDDLEVTGLFKLNTASDEGIQLNVKQVLFDRLTLKALGSLWLDSEPDYSLQLGAEFGL